MVNEAKIDALAAALGSVHGTYSGEPVLGFDEMLAISEATGAPLVLHGGSGIPEYQIKKQSNVDMLKSTLTLNYNNNGQQQFVLN